MTSAVSRFANDTQAGHVIASEEDMTQLQTDLENVYCWAVRNKMEFNSDKFEFIQYSSTMSTLDMKNTKYYSNTGTPIQQQKDLLDLGVTISEDTTCSQYIHYDGRAQSYNPGLQYPHLHGPVHTPHNNRWDTPPV